MIEKAKEMEFSNALNACRKRADYLLDIYREVVAAFEKEKWDAKGPEMALRNAEHAGIITSLEHKRWSEDWQEVISKPKGADFGDLQERIEKKMFADTFKCTLKSVAKLGE